MFPTAGAGGTGAVARGPKAAVNSKPMPKSLLRALVVLFVALTVPVQGMAAVTAGLCMALGQHGTQAAHEDGASGHVHDHGAVVLHQHDEGKGSDKSSHNSHCPPCVSCCAAAAIASFSPVFVPEQVASNLITALPEPFHGVAPDRLDRPPLAL